MISTDSELAQLCARVQSASNVGFDTEFHNERSFTPRLMVLQLAFQDGVAIVDPLAVANLRPLAEALCETTVVGHALAGDLKILAERFGIVPQRVFDCQIAASFLGYGMSISLADLVREIGGARLRKSQTISDWSARPLSAEQTEYLIADVAYLLPMQVTLTQHLREKGRFDWAREEFAQLSDLERYRVDERRLYARIPGSNRMSRREVAVLAELVQLRERIARERDIPLKFVLPDDVVAGLAVLRPRRSEDLAQLRRLDPGARRSLGPAILEAVRRAEALGEEHLPAKVSRPSGNARETLVALMSVAVGELARENDLPPSLLVPRASLERVAREVPSTREEFERALELSHWRMQLVSEPLWRLLCGSSGLRVEGYAQGEPRILVHE